MTIRGILLDKDGTLLDLYATWVPFLEDLLACILNQECPGQGTDLQEEILFCLGVDRQKKRIRGDSVLARSTGKDIQRALLKVLARRCPRVAENKERVQAEIQGHVLTLFQKGEPELHTLGDVPALLKGLLARGFSLGLVTADDAISVNQFLYQLNIQEFFHYVGTGDSPLPCKPHPDHLYAFARCCHMARREVAVVGDTTQDLLMARRGGAGLALGVLTGAGSREELFPLAHYLLPSAWHLKRFFSTAKG